MTTKDVGRLGVYMLCTYEIDECQHGLGPGLSATFLSETVQVIRLGESAGYDVSVAKKTHGPLSLALAFSIP